MQKKVFKTNNILKECTKNILPWDQKYFVRYVRGDNAMVDIVNSSGDLSRESVSLKNLAICTLNY